MTGSFFLIFFKICILSQNPYPPLIGALRRSRSILTLVNMCDSQLFFGVCGNGWMWRTYLCYSADHVLKYLLVISRIFYPPSTFFIFLFQLNFDPSFLPLAVRFITKRHVLVCRGYFLLLYMVKMTFDFCIKCYINISMQLLVWFGLERNNVTSFTGRCWQGDLRVLARRQHVMGWPHFAYICIMPCQTSGKKVCTRTQMFSADPEKFHPCEEKKNTKTRLLATCESWEKEKLCMNWDKMAKLPLNMETR